MVAATNSTRIKNIPSYITNFEARSKGYTNIHKTLSEINARTTEQQIDLLVSKVRDNNKLNFFSRLIDKFIFKGCKQQARDHLVTLAIADAYKTHVSVLISALPKERQVEIKNYISSALGKSISKMDYMNGCNCSTIEQCASHALHCLQQITLTGLSDNFTNLWTISNLKISFADSSKSTVNMTATVKLEASDGGPLSLDITVKDVSHNNFAINYMGLNAEKHLEEKRNSYKEFVIAYDEQKKIYNDLYEKLHDEISKIETLRNKIEKSSIEISENIADCLTLEDNSNSISNTESLIAEAIADAKVLEEKDSALLKLREECSSYLTILAETAENMTSHSRDYHDAAQAFYNIGFFLENNSELEEGSTWGKTLNYLQTLIKESTLVNHSFSNQRPALNTIRFNIISIDEQKYIQNELEKFRENLSKNALLTKANITESFVGDGRGYFADYIISLSESFEKWKKANSIYESHNRQLSNIADTIHKASFLNKSFSELHSDMLSAIINVKESTGDDKEFINHKKALAKINLFINAFTPQPVNEVFNNVNQIATECATLSNVDDSIVKNRIEAQEELQVQYAMPYYFPPIRIGEAPSDEELLLQNRVNAVSSKLSNIPPFNAGEKRPRFYQTKVEKVITSYNYLVNQQKYIVSLGDDKQEIKLPVDDKGKPKPIDNILYEFFLNKRKNEKISREQQENILSAINTQM